jgi:serine/threonine-protein kinase HipA
MENREIFVYFCSSEFVFLGTLHSAVVDGKEVFNFEASREYIKSGVYHFLDPDLTQFGGPQNVHSEKATRKIFLDLAPGKWSRLLLKHREAMLSKKENRQEKTLLESDYLLGVPDKNRLGAFRFKTQLDGVFLDISTDLPDPSFAELGELEKSSLMLESEENVSEKWLQMLIASGSPLGGSRPKINVRNEDGLWVAKFPSKSDDIDRGAWEAVACKLAQMCGIAVNSFFIKKYTSEYHTFLMSRFDRRPRRRIHLASAAAQLGYIDGNEENSSWMELAEFIIKRGNRTDSDLEELWRRLVFSIAISNSGCHLRNHTFLLTLNKAWVLSPAYGFLPDSSATGLALNVNENNNTLNFDLAMEMAPLFRLDARKSREILRLVKNSVARWKGAATEFKIPKKEWERMEWAFRRVK